MAGVEEPEGGEPRDHRLGEQEEHHEVDDRADAEREREALHHSDGEDEEDDGSKQGHSVCRETGCPGAHPAGLDRHPHRLPAPHLVTDAFEVDDERVGRDAHRDDQAGDAGQREREADRLAHGQYDGVRHESSDGQGRRDDQAETAVVEQAVEQHQAQPDGAGDQPGGQLVGGQGRPFSGHDGDFELEGKRAVLEAVRECLRLGLGEVAADLGLTVGDHAVHGGGGDHLSVQDDGELLLLAGERAGLVGDGAGHRGERLARRAVEGQVDHPLHLVLRDAGLGLLQLGALDQGRRQQQLVAVLVAGHQRLVLHVADRRGRLALGRAGERSEPLQPPVPRVVHPLQRLVHGRARWVGLGLSAGVSAGPLHSARSASSWPWQSGTSTAPPPAAGHRTVPGPSATRSSSARPETSWVTNLMNPVMRSVTHRASHSTTLRETRPAPAVPSRPSQRGGSAAVPSA